LRAVSKILLKKIAEGCEELEMNSAGHLTLTALSYSPSFEVGEVADRKLIVINNDAVSARNRALP
jgi:hypothetical protein